MKLLSKWTNQPLERLRSPHLGAIGVPSTSTIDKSGTRSLWNSVIIKFLIGFFNRLLSVSSGFRSLTSSQAGNERGRVYSGTRYGRCDTISVERRCNIHWGIAPAFHFGLSARNQGGDWQFPNFSSFPSKGTSHADLARNASPATYCQFL